MTIGGHVFWSAYDAPYTNRAIKSFKQSTLFIYMANQLYKCSHPVIHHHINTQGQILVAGLWLDYFLSCHGLIKFAQTDIIS